MQNIFQKILETDLLLFDLDGLLVDTESVHHQAYQKMCLDRGYSLPWDFKTYCRFAHIGSDLLEKEIYKEFPHLKVQEPNWKILHTEKQKAFLEIIQQKGVHLMPGVEKMLQAFPLQSKRSCIVTHSSLKLTRAILQQLPILQTIPHFVTREQYSSPKPHPDAYLTAIRLYGKIGDTMLGFEDSVRGCLALKAASIPAIVISSILSPEDRKDLEKQDVVVYGSFQDFILQEMTYEYIDGDYLS
jgi:HAD superfamily hydrolase (TIGR01509 family)